MNRDLQNLVKDYATLDHKRVIKSLRSKSKDDVITALVNLLTHYFNDKNSSSLREAVIVSLCGYKLLGKKIGYNGYRQDSITGKTLHCEAKPKNINTNDEKPKLNGGANFTDYTWARFERDKRKNPEMIMGGFIDGKLIYTFQFPFKTPHFLARLEDRLTHHFPDGDISGEFLRSADFRLDDYKSCLNQSNVHVYVDKKTLSTYKKYLTKKLYNLVEGYAK